MSAEPEVVDDKEQSRYEVHLDGETVAIADYVKAPARSPSPTPKPSTATKAKAWRAG